jgi:hypothetical protein
MTLSLNEILRQNIKSVEPKNTNKFGQFVSDQLVKQYPLLDQRVLARTRNISFHPRDGKAKDKFQKDFIPAGGFYECGNRFFDKPGADISKPQVNIRIPLIFIADFDRFEGKEIQFKASGTTKIKYSICGTGDIPKKHLHSETGKNPLILLSRYGTHKVVCEGTWTDRSPVEYVNTRISAIPKEVRESAARARAEYNRIVEEALDPDLLSAQTLAEITKGSVDALQKALRQAAFAGQKLETPVLYAAWIPKEEDFGVPYGSREEVSPEVNMILRVDGKYDHVVGSPLVEK